MFPFHRQRKIADIVLLKSVSVAVQRTDKIVVLKHGEQEAFGDGA